jgi:uncharacterized protein DUF998
MRTMQKRPLPMARQTGALLVCGALAGPLYIAVTAIQALTRAGFDPTRHRYNLLTTGDLGWIHRANYVVAGILMVLFAVGVRRMLRHGRSALWVPWLLGLYGVAYISSGLFTADPVIGFPPGTVSESTTWHAMVQMASRSISSAALIAASLVMARWFNAQGLRSWAWFSLAAVPLPLGAYALLVATGVDKSTTYLAFLVPGILMWVWVTALAVHLYRRAERDDAAPGQVMQGTLA